MLQESDIHVCGRLFDRVDRQLLSNFEMRMVAEVKLYWITYHHCINGPVDPGTTQVALQAWRAEWESLFGKGAII